MNLINQMKQGNVGIMAEIERLKGYVKAKGSNKMLESEESYCEGFESGLRFCLDKQKEDVEARLETMASYKPINYKDLNFASGYVKGLTLGGWQIREE